MSTLIGGLVLRAELTSDVCGTTCGRAGRIGGITVATVGGLLAAVGGIQMTLHIERRAHAGRQARHYRHLLESYDQQHGLEVLLEPTSMGLSSGLRLRF